MFRKRGPGGHIDTREPQPVSLTHLPPGQNVRLFADDISRYIFVNEKFCILIKILLKSVPKGPIGNKPALVQIMAWRRIGDRPLSEPMLLHWRIYAAPEGDEFNAQYSAVAWVSYRPKSPATRLLAVPQLVQANNKRNIKAQHYWSFEGRTIGDQ